MSRGSHRLASRRGAAWAALGVACALLVAGPGAGQTATSESFTLQAAALSAGGTSGAEGASSGVRLGASIGLPGPQGTLSGPSGTTLRSGFWAAAFASGDRDGDGIADVADNCTLVPNPDQSDANAESDDDPTVPGIQHYGDACDADLDGDGIVGASDFFVVLRPCFGVTVATDPSCAAADLDGDGVVGASDFFVVFRPSLGDPPGPGVTR